MTITVSVFQYEWHCDEHHDGFLFGDVDESADRMIRSAMEHAKDFHANAEIDNQIGGHADE